MHWLWKVILFNFQEFCLTTSRKTWYLVRYFKFLNPYKCNPACVSSGRTCEYELQRENSPLFFLMDLLPVSINLSITLSVDQLSFFSRWKNKRESHRHAHSSTRLDMNIIDVLYYLTWDIKCLLTLFWGYGDLSKNSLPDQMVEVAVIWHTYFNYKFLSSSKTFENP